MSRVALFGAQGFVGSAVHKSLVDQGAEVIAVSRSNFDEALRGSYDYVINSAMPSARFKAKNDPMWDFKETVEKTALIFHKTHFKKFIQISSVSARCQLDTVYGRHKLAAEAIVNDGKHLVVRLGPMFGPTLKKGILIDMLKGDPIFVNKASRYAFAPLDFVADWISKNLDRRGMKEVGAHNSISLADLAQKLDYNPKFEGQEDHQEMQGIESNYPDVELVLAYMRNKRGKTE
ncbi:MAG: NAD(P)-dependent oxidoreductase [Bdellovibrionia bacterium]